MPSVPLGFRRAVESFGRAAMTAFVWSLGTLIVAFLISVRKARWVPRQFFSEGGNAHANGVLPPPANPPGGLPSDAEAVMSPVDSYRGGGRGEMASCDAVPGSSFELRVPKAVDQMVVDHADRLHERVADRGADEFEAPAFQILAHRVGFRRVGRHLAC